MTDNLGRHLPPHVFDDGETKACPDCGATMENDEGRWVHVDTGDDECGPRAFAWVKYDATRITELICDRCVTPLERIKINDRLDGILPIYERGTIVCRRCLEVA
jgi:hypothetical protein